MLRLFQNKIEVTGTKYYWWEVVDRLKEYADIPPPPTDMYYIAPDRPQWLLEQSKAWKYQYIPEKRDCEDFVRIFRGWLSQQGLGNVLAMSVKIKKVNGKHHQVVGFLATNGLQFGDPQSAEYPVYADAEIEDIRL